MSQAFAHSGNSPPRSLLVFSLQGQRMAVDALAVREICSLMEITPVADAPRYVVGVANIRGKVVPVLAPGLRFGWAPERFSITDGVIVLDAGDISFGIVVNEVNDIVGVHPSNVEPSPLAGPDFPVPSRFIAEIARSGDDILGILDHTELLRDVKVPGEMHPSEVIARMPGAEGYFYSEAGPEDRAVFRERARVFRQPPEDGGVEGLAPVAVAGLNGEYFGVELQLVHEFADVGMLAPIPCCPEHVVGNMNLRGNIVTLVDVRMLLGMPVGRVGKGSKVIVAGVADLTVGVLVDSLFDIVYVDSLDLKPPLSSARTTSEAYVKGAVPYGGKMMTVLDLAGMLTSDALRVDEDPTDRIA
ncbi:MAG: chemotaxis protein CheW [Thermodesulfobacteriota bacterium]